MITDHLLTSVAALSSLATIDSKLPLSKSLSICSLAGVVFLLLFSTPGLCTAHKGGVWPILILGGVNLCAEQHTV